MPPNPSRLPTSMLIAFGLVNLPLSMLMSPTAGLGHLMTWYLVVTLGWMLIGIPHTAMAAELSHDCHERSRIALWRQLLRFAGGVLFMVAPMRLLAGTTKFTPEVMRAIAAFIMVTLPLAVLLLGRAVPEPVRRAAIFFSFQAIVTRLNPGVGGAVALAIPTLFGFDAGHEVTVEAAVGLKVAFVAWPCLLLAPMLLLAWHYPLDRRARGVHARRLASRPEIPA